MMNFEVFISREKDPDWLSSLIMKYLGTNYSHIGVIVNGDTAFHTYKGAKGMVRESVGSFLDRGKEIVDVREVAPFGEDFAHGYLTGRIGTPYSHSQYMGIIFPNWRDVINNKSGKSICSEEVARFLNDCAVGYDFKDPDFLDPKQVWDVVRHDS